MQKPASDGWFPGFRGRLAGALRSPPPAGDTLRHYALAAGLMLAGPLLRFLHYERYPLLTREVAVLVTALVVLGIGLVGIAWRLGPRAVDVVFAILLVVFIDFQFDLTSARWFLAATGGAIALSLLFRRRRASLVALTLAAFYLVSIPSRRYRPAAIHRPEVADGRPNLRPIVHLILDEQIGPGGLRVFGDTAAAQFLEGFYRSRGFDVYRGAYSRLYWTRRSIPAVMSLGRLAESAMVERILPAARPGGKRRDHYWRVVDDFRVVRNPYFRRLAAAGYKINVYQTNFVDFCHDPEVPVATCVQVPAVTVSNVSYLRAGWVQKARRILDLHLHHAEIIGRWWPSLRGTPRSAAGGGIHLLESMMRDMHRASRSGNAFIAHVMMPHGPFETDSTCRYRRDREGLAAGEPGKRAHDFPAMFRAYTLQVRCVHRMVSRLIDSIDAAFGPREAIIIVHGDHGFRFTEPAYVGMMRRFRPKDFSSGFSTLLAVRHPGSRGIAIDNPVPVQDFIAAFADSFRVAPPRHWDNFVYFSDPDQTVWTRRPLKPEEMPWTGSIASSY